MEEALRESNAPAVLRSRFSNDDLLRCMKQNNIDASILVQAAASIHETSALLDIAKRIPSVLGVVGWIDFDNVASISVLDHWLSVDNQLVGVRPMVQDIDDVKWISNTKIKWAIRAIAERNLVLDALGYTTHMPGFLTVADKNPDITVVIDHAMKPTFIEENFGAWAAGMKSLAANTNVYCKLSGLMSEAGSGVSTNMLKPYVELLLSLFGPSRIIWGSNWPVDMMVGSYAKWVEITDELLSGLSEHERSHVMGGNAATAYHIRCPADGHSK